MLKGQTLRQNPFNLTNDFVEYFYYPTSLSVASDITFSLIKENQLITAIDWNAYNTQNKNVSIEIQVPRLTISLWSGKLKIYVQLCNF